MPLTIAHVVAAAPLRYPLGRSGVLAALVVGSIMPDVPLYLPLGLNRNATHSAIGLLWFCLPVGVLSYVLYDYVLDRPLRALVPEGLQQRLSRVGREARPPAWSPAVLVCLLLGAATHTFWDSFTHGGSAGVQMFPVLETRLFTVSGYTAYVFSVLQHASTVFGLTVLTIWIWRWYRRAPVAEAPPGGLARGPRQLLLAVIVLAVAVAAGVAAVRRPPVEANLRALQPVARRVVVSSLSTLVAAVTLYAIGWHSLRRGGHN